MIDKFQWVALATVAACGGVLIVGVGIEIREALRNRRLRRASIERRMMLPARFVPVLMPDGTWRVWDRCDAVHTPTVYARKWTAQRGAKRLASRHA